MKKTFIIAVLALLLVGASGCSTKTTTSGSDNLSNYKVDQSDLTRADSLIKNIPLAELDSNEKAGLIQMREEEKLARDVYQYLYQKWGQPIFNNIAQSEQTHTDAIKALLVRYNIEDPVKNDEKGVFSSPEMQKLYTQLTSAGEKSLLDALKVGATVEDLDIKDLSNFILKTDNQDIQTVYQNLMKGSRNHLRAFTKRIQQEGDSYQPEYIADKEYKQITNSEQEKYQLNSQGQKINPDSEEIQAGDMRHGRSANHN